MAEKNKYDLAIERIEELVTQEYPESKSNIIRILARDGGLSERDFSTVISFMTDMSARKYISRRKMQAAYKYLIEQAELNIGGAVDISGYDNQSSFSKEFSLQFNMTPKDAFQKKDRSFLEEPLYISKLPTERAAVENTLEAREEENVLFDEEYDRRQITPKGASKKKKRSISKEPLYGTKLPAERAAVENTPEAREEENILFGEEYCRCRELKEAFDLQALYDLDDGCSNIAYEYAKNEGIPLEDAFEYIDRLWSKEPIDHQQLQELVDDPAFAYCYLSMSSVDNEPSYDLAYNAMFRLEPNVSDIRTLAPQVIDLYAHANCALSFAQRAWDYYNANKNEWHDQSAWECYMRLLLENWTIEDAFDECISASKKELERFLEQERRFQSSEHYGAIEARMQEMDEYYDEYEAWATENMGCGTIHERFEKEYDTDNYHYELSDEDTPSEEKPFLLE